MSTIYAGTGTLLKVGDGASPQVFTTIAQILELSGVDMSTSKIDVTTHNAATTDYTTRKIGGLIEAGDVTFTIAFDPNEATHDDTATRGLLYLAQHRTVVDWKIAYPSTVSPAVTWTFSGFVSNFKTMNPLNDKITAQVSIALYGPYTLA